MIAIAKESLAPLHFEALRQKHRTSADGLVPEIVFCLFLCNGIRNSVGIEEIAAQASITYPGEFYTWVNGEPVPDLALILLTLCEASSPEWRYANGDWFQGWPLTGEPDARDPPVRFGGRGSETNRVSPPLISGGKAATRRYLRSKGMAYR